MPEPPNTRQAEILIRALEPADIPGLTEAWNQPLAYAGTLQLPYTSVETRQRRIANTPATLTRLVAVIEGKVIGCLGLGRYENRRSHAGQFGMAVHDAYAGRGAGSALLAAAIDLADNWLNLKRLELSAYADNARAIALYERFGCSGRAVTAPIPGGAAPMWTRFPWRGLGCEPVASLDL